MLWDILRLALPVTFRHNTARRSLALEFSAAIHFAMKRSAPCSAVLRHSPLSWATVVHWSALIPKALRSSRKHPVHSFFRPPKQPAPPINFPYITQFGGLVSSMRATNPANKLSLPRLDKRVEIENRVVGAIVLSPTDAASQETVVGSAKRVVVARARVPRDAVV